MCYPAGATSDVQLKRRHDLLPKLVTAIKQYTDYEQATHQVVPRVVVAGKSLPELWQIPVNFKYTVLISNHVE